MRRVTVLGGGNGSHAAVVDLALKGFSVAWWRRDRAAFPEDGEVRYTGLLGSGVVRPDLCTDDLAEAVEDAELVLAPVPAPAQHDLVGRLAGVLAPGQVVAFTPGTLGTWIGNRARPDVIFMETGTLPYLTRLTAPAEVAVPVVATRLPVGSVPGVGAEADRAHALFSRAYPSAVRLRDGLDAALTNWGPVIHPPLVVCNLGAIESLGDRFDIHAEGTSETVRRLVLALDAERVRLRERLGIPGEHWPIRTHYERSPKGMYGADAKERLIASGLWRESLDLDHRYITEDILCGLVLNVSLGRLAGSEMPVGESLLTITVTGLDRDVWAEGRTAASLGIDDLEEAQRLAQEGSARA